MLLHFCRNIIWSVILVGGKVDEWNEVFKYWKQFEIVDGKNVTSNVHSTFQNYEC